MCALCNRTPCDSRCPNAPDPEPVMICCECEEGIFAGQKYLRSEKGPICEDCLHSMTGLDVLELLGEEMIEAKEE